MIAYSSPHPPGDRVLVVGAGPAGATAARALALAGVPVRLLDRAVFPRNKPCGGGISLRVLRRFPYLRGALEKIATHYLSRMHIEGPDGASAVIESESPAALMVRRVEFDALLVSLAVQAGAELVQGIEVVQAASSADSVTLTSRDGERLKAPIVIAADGVHSVVARRLGLNHGWPASSVALDMMEETPRSALRDLDPTTLWVAYGYEPPPVAREAATETAEESSQGYAYIFPKRDHVNIGVGYVLSHYRRQVHGAPYELQRGFVKHLRERGIIEGQSVRENFTPFLIPVGGPLPCPGRGRVLLTGDAAGFVNAFTAEGIYYAMVSGELAARAVIGMGAEPSRMARQYRRSSNYEIGVELRDSVYVQRYLFEDRGRISAAIAGAHCEPAITRVFLDLAIGRRTYRDVRRRVLARRPGLAVRFLWERLRAAALRFDKRWLDWPATGK